MQGGGNGFEGHALGGADHAQQLVGAPGRAGGPDRPGAEGRFIFRPRGQHRAHRKAAAAAQHVQLVGQRLQAVEPPFGLERLAPFTRKKIDLAGRHARSPRPRAARRSGERRSRGEAMKNQYGSFRQAGNNYFGSMPSTDCR